MIPPRIHPPSILSRSPNRGGSVSIDVSELSAAALRPRAPVHHPGLELLSQMPASPYLVTQGPFVSMRTPGSPQMQSQASALAAWSAPGQPDPTVYTDPTAWAFAQYNEVDADADVDPATAAYMDAASGIQGGASIVETPDRGRIGPVFGHGGGGGGHGGGGHRGGARGGGGAGYRGPGDYTYDPSYTVACGLPGLPPCWPPVWSLAPGPFAGLVNRPSDSLFNRLTAPTVTPLHQAALHQMGPTASLPVSLPMLPGSPAPAAGPSPLSRFLVSANPFTGGAAEAAASQAAAAAQAAAASSTGSSSGGDGGSSSPAVTTDTSEAAPTPAPCTGGLVASAGGSCVTPAQAQATANALVASETAGNINEISTGTLLLGALAVAGVGYALTRKKAA